MTSDQWNVVAAASQVIAALGTFAAVGWAIWEWKKGRDGDRERREAEAQRREQFRRSNAWQQSVLIAPLVEEATRSLGQIIYWLMRYRTLAEAPFAPAVKLPQIARAHGFISDIDAFDRPTALLLLTFVSQGTRIRERIEVYLHFESQAHEDRDRVIRGPADVLVQEIKNACATFAELPAALREIVDSPDRPR